MGEEEQGKIVSSKDLKKNKNKNKKKQKKQKQKEQTKQDEDDWNKSDDESATVHSNNDIEATQPVTKLSKIELRKLKKMQKYQQNAQNSDDEPNVEADEWQQNDTSK